MTEASKQVPPVPSTFPVLEEDLGGKEPKKVMSHPWARWFIAVREKINAINAALINLGIFVDSGATGIPVINGDTWTAIIIAGTPGRVTVVNGDGVAGNPTIDTEGNVRTLEVINELVLDDTDPEALILTVDPLFISRNQTAAQWVAVPVTATSSGTIGDISMDADYLYTCEGTNTWKRSSRASW